LPLDSACFQTTPTTPSPNLALPGPVSAFGGVSGGVSLLGRLLGDEERNEEEEHRHRQIDWQMVTICVDLTAKNNGGDQIDRISA